MAAVNKLEFFLKSPSYCLSTSHRFQRSRCPFLNQSLWPEQYPSPATQGSISLPISEAGDGDDFLGMKHMDRTPGIE